MPKPSSSQRLDLDLVERGVFESREKAQRAILAGEVWIGGHRAAKPSDPCPPDAVIEWKGRPAYVSRAGGKLEAGLESFGIDPTGKRCLDVGASTGGFTDCLLSRGAAHVVAIDVGRGQLDWKLRQDPRVEVREGVNARYLKPDDFSALFDIAVVDVSFISLRLVLPAIFGLLTPKGQICALIKPQFEAGRAEVGKGGIVRDENVRRNVVAQLQAWLLEHPHMRGQGVIDSPVPGKDGNREFLWHLTKAE